MSKSQSLIVLTGLMLIGFALRIYHIDTVSFRGDEAFTVLNWVSQPLSVTLQSDIPLRDPQPPLAFAIFRLWALTFGSSEFSMRVLPALFSMLGIPAVYALGKRIRNRNLGLLAALFFTLHPFLIYHAQDAKAYAIWASFSAISVWLALRALDKNRRLDWLLYIAVAAITAYLYYLELFSLLALNVFVLIAYRRRWRPWLLSQGAIALLLAPWYLQPRLFLSSGYGGTAAGFSLDAILTRLLPTLIAGPTLVPGPALPAQWPTSLALVILLLTLLAIAATILLSRRFAPLLVLLAIVPFVALSLASLRLNVFAPRYILSTVPIFALMFASLILAVWLNIAGMRRALPVLLCGLFVAVQLVGLGNYYANPVFAKAPDWRGLTDYLFQAVEADDLVVQTAADEAFTLYYGRHSDFERLPANPDQSQAEINNRLARAADNYSSIWLVAQPHESWPNASAPQDWLDQNMQLIRESQLGTLPIRQYMPWTTDIPAQSLANFEGIVDFVAMEVSPATDPDGRLTILTYWQPESQSDRPLKIFVHLMGEVNNPASGTALWSQDDQFPQDDRLNTSTWSTGTVFRDVYHLPISDLPAGDYNLVVGLYDPENGQRLLTDAGMDNYIVRTVTLP